MDKKYRGVRGCCLVKKMCCFIFYFMNKIYSEEEMDYIDWMVKIE